MKRVVRAIIYLLFTLSITGLAFWFLLTQSEPVVASKPGMHFSDLKRVQGLAKEFQPSKLVAGNRYVVTLSQRELNLAAVTLLSQLDFARSFNINLEASEDVIGIQVSIPMKFSWFERWLNFSLDLDVNPGHMPTQSNLMIHHWNLPVLLNDFVQDQWQKLVPPNLAYLWQSAQVKVGVVDQGVLFGFSWNPEATSILPDFYQHNQQSAAKDALKVLEAVSRLENERLQLNEFFTLVFKYWQPKEADLPVFMVVLSQYISGNSIGELYAISTANPDPVRLYLSGRQDLARHFLISAMLTSQAGETVANQLGYLKELSDADNKLSGFSVSDLLANKAGILFYSKLHRAVREGLLDDFILDLELQLLPGRKELDKLDEVKQEWDETALSEQLNRLPFYSTKPISGRHR